MTEFAEFDGLRAQIDAIDSEILTKLQQRQQVVGQIAVCKRSLGLDAYQPQRFMQILERLKAEGMSMGVDPGLVEGVWSVIHSSSVATQENHNPSQVGL